DVAPVDLHSLHVLSATVTYDAINLSVTITDTTNGQTFSLVYPGINIPALVGSNMAYVGFTGATGGANAIQEVVTWTYTPIVPPGIPTNVAASVTGYTATSTSAGPIGAHVTWNAVSGAAGYKIERKVGPGGTYAQVGNVMTNSFDDTGLATQTNYYYRVRAYNSSGDGAYSAEVSINTPALAPTPTNGTV